MENKLIELFERGRKSALSNEPIRKLSAEQHIERLEKKIKENPDKVKTNIRAIRDCGCTGVDFLSDDYTVWLEKQLDVSENISALLYSELQDVRIDNKTNLETINRLLRKNTKLKHDAELKKAINNIKEYESELNIHDIDELIRGRDEKI